MHTLDLSGMALFFAVLASLLGVVWWMLRLNARDLASLERELAQSLPPRDADAGTPDGA